jgi:Zn finger protein HypA/HybF involved in hydrogenase expression
MRAESEAWRLRCSVCGATRSVWEAGGIRWKAAAVNKQTRAHCPHCGGLRATVVERTLASTN